MHVIQWTSFKIVSMIPFDCAVLYNEVIYKPYESNGMVTRNEYFMNIFRHLN